MPSKGWKISFMKLRILQKTPLIRGKWRKYMISLSTQGLLFNKPHMTQRQI